MILSRKIVINLSNTVLSQRHSGDLAHGLKVVKLHRSSEIPELSERVVVWEFLFKRKKALDIRTAKRLIINKALAKQKTLGLYDGQIFNIIQDLQQTSLFDNALIDSNSLNSAIKNLTNKIK